MKPIASLFLLLFPLLSMAAVQVTGGRIVALADGSQLIFDLSAPVQHDGFLLDNPPRYVIDIKNAYPHQLQRSLRSAEVLGVRSGELNKRDLRIVIDLKRPFYGKTTLVKDQHDRLIVDLFRHKKPIIRSPKARPTGSVSSVSTIELISKSQVTLISPSLAKITPPTQPKPIAKPKPPEQKKPPQPAKPKPTITKAPAAKPLPAQVKRRAILIAIDPGHGGKDPGAIGPGGTREKDVVLQIAQHLQQLINAEAGMQAFLTRNSNKYLKLHQRIAIAQKRKADLFISIHADAFTNPDAHGASVFMLSTRGSSSAMARWLAKSENKADLVGGGELDIKDRELRQVVLDIFHDGVLVDSQEMAKQVLRQLDSVGELHSKKVERANFAVLKAANIPSILVETAFISNPDEEAKLRSPDYQAQLAHSILKGVKAYADQRPRLGEVMIATAQPSGKKHIIKKGETLWSIARQYKVSLANLIAVNKLDHQLQDIPAGIAITIPSS